MEKLTLEICKKSEGFDYGHDEKSVEKYEKILSEIECYFKDKEIKDKYNILGVKVSNSGCNIWLIIWHNEKRNHHTIHTTQNEHLGKFGFAQRRTDLDRFLKN